jgi:hypothetical protein
MEECLEFHSSAVGESFVHGASFRISRCAETTSESESRPVNDDRLVWFIVAIVQLPSRCQFASVASLTLNT